MDKTRARNQAATARSRSTAAERWKILRRAILAANRMSVEDTEPTTRASVRSFASFELFHITDIKGEKLRGLSRDKPEGVWKVYSWETSSATCDVRDATNDSGVIVLGEGTEMPGGERVTAIISHLSPKTSLEAMMGFNNTGNVCIWPSEEVLTQYCLNHREQFRGKAVCELGGGMTCLAGLMLAQTGLPTRVTLTDGNAASVENVRCILYANREESNTVEVSADVLLWDQAFLESEHSVFDFVICADCLFFVDLHQTLCQVICKLLGPGGTALLFNPARSGTLEQFVGVAEKLFAVQRYERYSSLVWEKHCAALSSDRYRSDLHYPVLLVLKPL